MEGFDPSQVEDDDELDENDPALEELGLSLAPKSNKEKKKVRSLSTYIHPHLERKGHWVHATKDHVSNIATLLLVVVVHLFLAEEKRRGDISTRGSAATWHGESCLR